MDKQPRRAIVYCRVSTVSQEDGTSLDSQMAACVQEAANRGCEVAEILTEIESGGLYLARPKMQAALAAIESGEADALIVYKLDRTGREVGALRDIRRRIAKAGGQLIFADGMQFDKNASGNLMFTVMGAFAENEREVIRERTVRGARAKAQSGRMPSVGYSPYGYRAIRKSDIIKGTHPEGSDGTYELVESEAHLVPLIFEKYVELRSLRRAASWLSDNGHRTRAGKLWKPSVLGGIIGNPIYKGEPAYGKRKRHTDEARLASGYQIEYIRAAPRGDWITCAAPALVSCELWEEANALRRAGTQQRSGQKEKRYLLTGLMFCPECGRRMYALKRSWKYHDSAARTHAFKCGAVYPYVPGHPLPCTTRSYNGIALEQLVIESLCYVLQHPHALQTALKSYQRTHAQKADAGGDQADIARMEKQIAKLQKREQAAAVAALEARLAGSDGAAYETLRAGAESERKALESALGALQRDAGAALTAPPLPQASACSETVALLQSEKAPLSAKAESLAQLIECAYPVGIEETPVKWGRYNIGGAAIILKAARGACWIVQTLIMKRGQNAAITQTKTTITVTDANPFPHQPHAQKYPRERHENP
jgi:site-specific DNA recombinase